uniref:Uncharacterized protein n=2 Tax=Guillardia theta TaxID=55529 RepID=A0A7S4NYE8_GUITH|mmetsp:Transcript_37393/g.117840  ORF Transcript_37393/g.117840 Transcript_37393/m.117840 type:complete len:161 (+) Transcript_37393:443-925(+)
MLSTLSQRLLSSHMSPLPRTSNSVAFDTGVSDSSQDRRRSSVYSVDSTVWQDDVVPLYRHNEHFPGYTGHVPKLNQTHGTRYSHASRMALQTPPSLDRPPVMFYQGKRARRVISSTHLLPGNTFSGLAKPTGEKGRGDKTPAEDGLHTYLQGSHVDLAAY